MNLEGCLTLTFILTTLHISVNEGEGNTGSLNARRNSEALRQANSEHNARKRTQNSNNLKELIFNLSLETLANITINSDNWTSVLNSRESPLAVSNDEMLSRDNTERSIIDISPELSHDQIKTLLPMAQKRRIRSRRHAVHF